jgi:hypothetical protein
MCTVLNFPAKEISITKNKTRVRDTASQPRNKKDEEVTKEVGACAVVNKDPRCVRKRQPEPR